ncbi:hypothetical protein [Aeromonas simiae]|uniref:hypothetical protein n=1 Tax=Aeromonas simiae TaxID=218936 RepID=UPI00266D02A6|nr:hypothetical protein [Aeromonas simiae]MDO2950022.1 hypothetical protein [Aeromonas simiae]MDO2952294.1 hypothetical protein [Aeromonas simiae]MDO2957401.1 hypothetical protein [Aeromonas simiae]
MRVELNDDNISWMASANKVVIPGDFIDAIYDKKLNEIIALDMGGVYLFSERGLLVRSLSLKSSGYQVYCLASEGSNTDSVIRVVIAHEPPFRGERFWQHDVNIENGMISDPITQWR